MRTENLLIELGTEELPPKALKTLGQSFADNMEQALKDADLSYEAVSWFAAPAAWLSPLPLWPSHSRTKW